MLIISDDEWRASQHDKEWGLTDDKQAFAIQEDDGQGLHGSSLFNDDVGETAKTEEDHFNGGLDSNPLQIVYNLKTGQKINVVYGRLWSPENEKAIVAQLKEGKSQEEFRLPEMEFKNPQNPSGADVQSLFQDER